MGPTETLPEVGILGGRIKEKGLFAGDLSRWQPLGL